MSIVKRCLSAILRAVQAIALIVPFALQYFGSHRMGAHRHFKVRGDQYLSGILSAAHLTIAAIAVAIVLLLLLYRLYIESKRKPQGQPLRSLAFAIVLSAAFLLFLLLPAARTILIFPWLLFCLATIWLMQLGILVLRAPLFPRNEDQGS